MTGTVSEAWISGDGEDSTSGYNRTLNYYTFNESDEGAAATLVIDASPTTYEGIPRVGMSRKQITDTVFQFAVQYKLDSQQTQLSDPDTNTFNTTTVLNLIGGTTHITNAIATTSYCKTGNSVVDIKKTIGLDLKTGQVRGVDVIAPVFDISVSTMFPNSVVTPTYIANVYSLVGRTNAATFKGFAIGEVLFKGARASKRGAENWEWSFEFSLQPNEADVDVDGITVPSSTIPKKGWEYIEVMYGDGTSDINSRKIQIPYQVNVHQVYKTGDFSLLKIGTAA